MLYYLQLLPLRPSGTLITVFASLCLERDDGDGNERFETASSFSLTSVMKRFRRFTSVFFFFIIVVRAAAAIPTKSRCRVGRPRRGQQRRLCGSAVVTVEPVQARGGGSNLLGRQLATQFGRPLAQGLTGLFVGTLLINLLPVFWTPLLVIGQVKREQTQ
jgi:hypothetical protein